MMTKVFILITFILLVISASRIKCEEDIKVLIRQHDKVDICDGDKGRILDLSITIINQDEYIQVGFFAIELEYDRSSLKIINALKNNTISKGFDLWQSSEDSLNETNNVYYLQAGLFNGSYLPSTKSSNILTAFRARYIGNGEPVEIKVRSLEIDLLKYEDNLYSEDIDTLTLYNEVKDLPERIINIDVLEDSIYIKKEIEKIISVNITGQSNNRINSIEIEYQKSNEITSVIKEIKYDNEAVEISYNKNNILINYLNGFINTEIEIVLEKQNNIRASGELSFEIKSYNDNSCVTRTNGDKIIINELMINSVTEEENYNYIVVDDGIIILDNRNKKLQIFDILGKKIIYNLTINKIELDKGIYFVKSNITKIQKIQINN